ncbi:probable 3-hydroxyisobutyryl-CoA hydrolase 2 isoform X2 [Lactuca sativa]|uniref:probable 3-hydroxyisobutyryl-CoA hydrolase 2 isoform X2 n=1 Tax=Lactuca sativa TaxID=4236 RepID=UPI000CD9E7F8|nr:probable 3-hydroxyisobutyryl-CoA hydrolase 2 isoform X2 [Lactuca sativa]
MARSFSIEEENLVASIDISNGKKVIINRPNKLNCLNYQVIVQLLKMFEVYENDPTIKFLMLTGNGRAFCSGGDITSLMMLTSAGHWSFGANFFRKQYTLNYLLGTYKKPLIVLLDGIVMGGGAGLSMNATFRIVTENTIFAMPEASIGSVPDVGSSNFLSRLPGEYVALTGVRLNGIEMVKCGLATHFILSKNLSSLENALSMMTSSNAGSLTKISEIIKNFEHGKNNKLEKTNSSLEMINECFSREDVENILSSLENLAACKHEKWIIDAIKSIKYASPLCLKLALKLIREGRHKKLEQCLACEHLVVSHLLRRTVNYDFYEGPRAMIIDKDKKPQWSPSKLHLVNEEMVSTCFSTIDDEDWQPLKLFARENSNQFMMSRI